jgi:hypothetical protein
VGATQGAGSGRGDRLALKLAALVAVAALVGCDSDKRTLPDASKVDLKRLRSTATHPIYWVGPEFDGLPLSQASERLVIYGTCEAPGGWPSEGGCTPPIMIQLEPFELGNWKSAVGCRGVRTFRGVPAVHQNGLVLFTGRRYVMIIARSADEELRIGRALRPLNGPHRRKLPPPQPDIAREVQKACG